MAPTAHIVVYYIRPDQEAIADSISIAVQGQLQNDIGISFSHSTLEPGAKVNITVRGEPNQRACISIVDESVAVNQVFMNNFPDFSNTALVEFNCIREGTYFC